MRPSIWALMLSLLLAVACTKSTPPPPQPPPPVQTPEAPPAEVPNTGSKKTYIGHSPDECARIRFFCPEGEEYFSDDKGCGCVKKDTESSNTP